IAKVNVDVSFLFPGAQKKGPAEAGPFQTSVVGQALLARCADFCACSNDSALASLAWALACLRRAFRLSVPRSCWASPASCRRSLPMTVPAISLPRPTNLSPRPRTWLSSRLPILIALLLWLRTVPHVHMYPEACPCKLRLATASCGRWRARRAQDRARGGAGES